jgi:hypothetical protein
LLTSAARPAALFHPSRGRRLTRPALLLLASCLAIALAGIGAARPAPALATSTLATRCDNVQLRSRPSTSSTKLATLSKGTRVVAVEKVSGGRWRSTCAGRTDTGRSWYKVTVVNGNDVSSRFGVGAVYAASSLLRRLDSDRSVRVSSIPALLTNLADNSVDEIVVANGTYRINAANARQSNSLWIGGDRYARRTRPITVRAETIGGVTFDAGGGPMGGLSFNGGAHDQTWIGFRFANGTTNQTGVIVFGGYAGTKAPYAITLRHITVDRSVHRVNTGTRDHAVYFSYALDTWRDIVIADLSVDASDSMGLASAIHMDHGYRSDAPNVAAHGVTVRRLTFRGNGSWAAQHAIILWKPTVRGWLFDGASIVNAGGTAVTFESVGARNVVFKNITSTGSGVVGFYSSMGRNPPGVTFQNNSFR